MSKNTSASEVTARFRHLLQVLDRGGKVLEAADADQDLCKTYRQLLTYLRSRSDAEIELILGGSNRAKTKHAEPRLRDEKEVAQLTARQIAEILEDDQQSRAQLAQVATLRFGMSTGAITQLRNRKALVEKLKTLLEHEEVQDSIARVASAKDEGTQ